MDGQSADTILDALLTTNASTDLAMAAYVDVYDQTPELVQEEVLEELNIPVIADSMGLW